MVAKTKLVRVRFKKRLRRTSTVESFRFSPEERIEFIPGQFLQIVFDEHNLGNKELNKYLSFSSSPAHEYVEVTKRLSPSIFSQKLKRLRENDSCLIKAPLGNCILRDDYKKIGFLIGGIGITPVISMLEYIVEEELSTDVILFYSNRNEEDVAFKEELDRFQIASSNIKVVYTVTDEEPKRRGYIFGRIDSQLILKEDRSFTERMVFIFGPPRMVEAMKDLCVEVGVPEYLIKTESFLGY